MSTNERGPLAGGPQNNPIRNRVQFTTAPAARKRAWTPAELESGLAWALHLAKHRPWPPFAEEPRLQIDRGLSSWNLPARRPA